MNSNASVMSARNVASLLTLRKPRIIHLLSTPPAKPSQFNPYSRLSHEHARLIRSIEAFLLSFSMPFNTNPYAPQQADDDMERASPYIIPTSALCDVLYLSPNTPEEDAAMQTDWSLAELLLCGALEEPAAGALTDVARGKQRDAKGLSKRAWIAGVNDIIVQEGGSVVRTRSPTAATPPERAPYKPDLARVLAERMSLPPTPDEDETESDEPSPVVQTRPSVEIERRVNPRAERHERSQEKPSRRHGLLTPPASDETSGELDSRITTPEPAPRARHSTAVYSTQTPKPVETRKETRPDSRTHVRKPSHTAGTQRPSLPHPAMKKPIARPAAHSRSHSHSHSHSHSRSQSQSHTKTAINTRSVRPYSNNNAQYTVSVVVQKKAPKWMFWKAQTGIAVA